MKNTVFIICLILSSISVFAQAPAQFNYQAVARDASDQPYQNTNLGIRISLIKGGNSGIVSYSERHLVTTSQLGVFNLHIGAGTPLFGELTEVDWGNDSYYIKVDMDPQGGTDYIYMGVNQLLSVPYALYAEKSGDGGGNDADADPLNEIQTISLNGTQIVLSNGGGTINLPTGTTDTDDQALVLNGTNLSIEDGNTVDLSSVQDGVDDADSNPTNELQTISLNGTQIMLSNGGGSINLPTGTTDTDDQALVLNGTNLSIEDGNTVDLSSVQDGVDDADSNPTNELQTLSKSGNTVTLSNGGGNFTDATDDADADPANELQTISLNGDQIALSNGGGTINLPSGTIDTDDQTLNLSGTNLSIADGNTIDLASLQDGVNDADSNPTNEIQTISLNGDQIALSNGGGTINLPSGTIDTDDQTLALNGTNLSIADGNVVDLASLQDGVNDADSNPTNELQTISKSGNTVTLSNGGGNFTDATDDADANPTNEIQTISLNGNQIALSNGGGAINLPAETIDTDDQTLALNGTNLSIVDGNTINLSSIQDGVDDADSNPTNELQTISKSGNTVTLSNGGGNFTDAFEDGDASPLNELQNLNFINNQLSISDGNMVDLNSISSPWTVVGDNISYIDGVTHTNSMTTNSVDLFGLDENTSVTASVISMNNGFANNNASLRSNRLLLSNGLNVSSLEAGYLNMIGVGESILTDSKLDFANTSGLISQLGPNGLAGNDVLGETNYSLHPSSGLRLMSNSQSMVWDYFKMSYNNVATGSTTEVYPGSVYLYNYQNSQDPFCGLSSDAIAFSSGAETSSLGINELVFQETPNLNKVRISAYNQGEIQVYNADSDETVVINSTSQKTGQIELKDESGNSSMLLTHLNSLPSHGYLAVKANDDEKAVMYATSDNAGLMRLRGANATTNVLLSSSNDNNGILSLYDHNDSRLFYLSASQATAGFMEAKASNIGGNSRNAILSWVSGYVGHGYFSVNDWSGNGQAGMYVDSDGDGVVFADIKNFRMDHPIQEDKEIWYASLEGPEAGAYERGTGQLEDGTTFIEFSNHFQLVGNHETMTVSLTPLSADTYGLAVIEKLANGFRVKELAGGSGSFSFDWEVKCVRKGYEDYQVIRDEKDVSPGE